MKKGLKCFGITLMLAAAMSMTAMADGWTKENGNQWVYYQNGSKVYNEWKTGADGSYYYLGNNGNMLTNSFIDGERYVDADGKMVTGGWRQIEGKWYYFDNNGRVIRDHSRQINGLWYYFDYDGAMMTGWVNDGDDWYYCDANAGGRMVTNTWRQIAPDPEMTYGDEDDGGPVTSDGTYWFYFLSSGKVCKANESGDYKEMMIGGNRYAFDEFGRMQTGWVKLEDRTPAIAGYKYYNDTESIGTYGAAHTGWLSAYPPEADGFGSDVQWFYFDSKGTPYYGTDVSGSDSDETLNAKLKRLEKNGRTQSYLFNEYGNPVYGLRKVKRSNGSVTSMYFGTKEESCLQLGEKSITDADGNTYTFHFDGSGYGYNGVKNGKLYYMGLLQKAYDDSFAFYQLPGSSDVWLVNKSGNIVKNKNSNTREDYVDYQSDASGRKGSKATADVSELIMPAFMTSEW